MGGSGRSRRGLVLLVTLLLGLGIGTFGVANLVLAVASLEPLLGPSFTPILFVCWLVGFAFGATLMGRLQSWSRSLLIFLGLLAIGASLLLSLIHI